MATPSKDEAKPNLFSGFAALASDNKGTPAGNGSTPAANPFASFGNLASGPLLFGQPSGSTPAFSFNASTFGSLSNSGSKKDEKKDEDDEEDDGGDDGDDAAAAADESHAADFKPIVSLAPVEVKSNEEDEDVVFKSRAKLFVFVKEDVYGDEVRKNWWRERGLGEIKVLKHRMTKESRLLMRQEKTLKICLNHKISPKTELKPTTGSEGKSWTFYAIDFADGEAKEGLFALKLPSADVATQFSTDFATAQKTNGEKTESSGAAPASPQKAVASPAKPAASQVATASPAKSKSVASPSAVDKVAKDLSKVEVGSTDQPPMAGGYSKRSPDEVEVKNVAKFAVEKIGQGELVKIASVKSQVVAGMNYRMALHIKGKTGEVFAHVVTVYQPLPHTKQPLSVTDHVVTGKIA